MTSVEPSVEARIRSDAYAASIGATLETLTPGYARVTLDVTDAMRNFHGITHGGIVFGLADIAFAAASNSHGQTAVALDVTITFLKATKPGEHLIADAREIATSGPTAMYEMVVTRDDEMIARCQATVFRKRETLA